MKANQADVEAIQSDIQNQANEPELLQQVLRYENSATHSRRDVRSPPDRKHGYSQDWYHSIDRVFP
jgi:hypothetical protein